jgi:hypothetical protein
MLSDPASTLNSGASAWAVQLEVRRANAALAPRYPSNR